MPLCNLLGGSEQENLSEEIRHFVVAAASIQVERVEQPASLSLSEAFSDPALILTHSLASLQPLFSVTPRDRVPSGTNTLELAVGGP